VDTAFATRTNPRRGRPKRFLADRNGATAVEFGLVAAPFVALLVGIIQTFLVIFAQQLLQTVVTQSSRFILTNQVHTANTTQSQFAQQVCDQVAILFNCSGLMIDVQTYSSFSAADTSTPPLTFNAQGQVTNTWQYNPGGPSQPGNPQIIIVKVMYQWPVFGGPLGFTLSNLPNGNRLIMATAAFQNEP
jgi:Flp pilus assembly protein TadG